MISSVSSQGMVQQANNQQNNTKLENNKQIQPQALPVQTEPAQGSVPPLHEYVKKNQIFNLIGATVLGTVHGIVDAKIKLNKKIDLNNSVEEIPDEIDEFLKLKDLPQEVKQEKTYFKQAASYKDLFSSAQYIETFKNVGTKVLCAAGILYALDFAFQKIFKNNQEYEEYYQESLKNKQ